MKNRIAFATVIAIVCALATNCTINNRATLRGGLTTFDNKTATHINTTKIALNLLIKKPLVGDASLQATMDEVAQQAKLVGSTQIRVVQSKSTVLWYIYPPFSFIIQPAIGNVAADAIMP